MEYCWRDLRKGMRIECNKSSCCYRATEQAVFDYWKFCNSDQWKEMIMRALEKETELLSEDEMKVFISNIPKTYSGDHIIRAITEHYFNKNVFMDSQDERGKNHAKNLLKFINLGLEIRWSARDA